MSILIAYASKYGCTEQCAEKLAQKFDEKVDLYNLKSAKPIDVAQYEKVIVGSSVYVGRVNKEATEFCTNNLEALKNKKIGLFICGSQEGEPLKQELAAAYPPELQSKAAILECFGGAYTFSKMSFMEKTIVKVIAKTNKDTSTIQEDKINSFAQALKNA
ncbi:MAG TPA: flavodoxin domain-containing protein [Patescibacteria group bacterium]|jgi:menaquinone-dependent protoporphyrinogen oxidase|nr:flavodoxin domain-containing protein [Patescibacteria group bacterium]